MTVMTRAYLLFVSVVFFISQICAYPYKTWNGSSWDGGEPSASDDVYITGALNLSAMSSKQLICANLTIQNGGSIIFDEAYSSVQINGSSITINSAGPFFNSSYGCYIEINANTSVAINSSSGNSMNIPKGVYLKVANSDPLIAEGLLIIESGAWIDPSSLEKIYGDVLIQQSGKADSSSWNLWSSPVNQQKIDNVFGPNVYAYKFPDGGSTRQDWIPLNNSVDTLHEGKGYCINGNTSFRNRAVDGGGSSSTHYQPFNNYWEAGRTQMIFLKSEIGGKATINNLSFNITQVSYSSYREFDNFKIKLLEVPETHFSTTAFQDMSSAITVFEETQHSMPSSTGWKTWDITDFEYSGERNLLLEISWGDNGKYTSSSNKYKVEYTYTGNNTVCYGYTDYDNGEYISPDGKNARRPNIKFGLDANPVKDFSGTLNTSATYSPTIPGFALVGNPFASHIDLYNGNDGFFEENVDLTGTAYFWIDDGSAGSAYTNADYAYWNASGATRANGVMPGGNVAPCQGFFVDVIQVPTNIQFRPSHCVNIEETFYRSQSINNAIQRLWIELESSEGMKTEMLLAFTDDATLYEDRLYDGKKIIVPGNPAIYSFIDGDIFSIQGMPQWEISKQIPIGLISNKDLGYTIRLRGLENFPQEATIILEDQEKGRFTDLQLGDYKINLVQDTFNQRFRLHLNLNASSLNEAAKIDLVQLNVANKIVSFKGLEGLGRIDKLELYDSSGRLIDSKEYASKLGALDYYSNVTGFHVIRLYTESGDQVFKVFI